MDINFDLKNGALTELNLTVFLLGAKATLGYTRAKAVIRYINRLADMINYNLQAYDWMKVVFVQNNNCSCAEHNANSIDACDGITM